ncbi:MAG: hypothetical protein WBQ14_06485 [Gaiellaceae bacterium]
MKRDPKQSGDQLNAFLNAGDPVDPSALSGDGVESALDEIGAEITDRSRRASSRRTRRLSMSKPRAALVIGFAAIGIGGAVAGGSEISAHTGRFLPTEEQIDQVARTNPEKASQMRMEEGGGGPGEDLNIMGADFEQIVRQLSSDIPYPEKYEYWREWLIADEVKFLKRTAESTEKAEGVETHITTGAEHGFFAMSGFCAWVYDWRDAELNGDSQEATEAAKVISEALNWKAVKDEDSNPDPTALGDSNGSSRFSLFGWMILYRDAVQASDRDRVDRLLISNRQGLDTCEIYDPVWRELDQKHARDPKWENREQRYAEYLAGKDS